MREARIQRDLARRQGAAREQGLGPLHAALDHVSVRRQPGRLLEQALEVRGADAGHAREAHQRKVLSEMHLHVFPDALELPLRQRAAGDLARHAVVTQQVSRERDAQSITVQRAVGKPGAALRLERPGDVLDLRVAELTALLDAGAIWIQPQLLGDSPHEGPGQTQIDGAARVVFGPLVGDAGRRQLDLAAPADGAHTVRMAGDANLRA